MSQDNININIEETNDVINIVSSEVTELIDINVGETVEEVTLNITEEIIQVNINKITGGGDQTLAQTLVFGNQTDGTDISISNGDEITFDNGSRIRKGLTDSGNGGAKGVALVCSLDYELKWEAGRQYVMQQDGFGIREVSHNFTITPTATDDNTKGFAIGSRWILDNGDVYQCTDATEDNAVWQLTTIDLSGYVPYTGATNDVNIGTNDLYTNKVFLLDEVNDNYASIHYADGDLHIEDADGHKLLVVEDGFIQLHLSDTIQSNLFTTLLTTTRDHYLPNASGTIALTSTRRNANKSDNNNINYCGVANGTDISESSAVWTITRLTIASSGSITIATATNVAWTNRESATNI